MFFSDGPIFEGRWSCLWCVQLIQISAPLTWFFAQVKTIWTVVRAQTSTSKKKVKTLFQGNWKFTMKPELWVSPNMYTGLRSLVQHWSVSWKWSDLFVTDLWEPLQNHELKLCGIVFGTCTVEIKKREAKKLHEIYSAGENCYRSWQES